MEGYDNFSTGLSLNEVFILDFFLSLYSNTELIRYIYLFYSCLEILKVRRGIFHSVPRTNIKGKSIRYILIFRLYSNIIASFNRSSLLLYHYSMSNLKQYLLSLFPPFRSFFLCRCISTTQGRIQEWSLGGVFFIIMGSPEDALKTVISYMNL